MYIPVLLPNPYTVSIIHDELIYGDTFINPDDLGKNIKSTFISNIGEISLEYCIKTILEDNKNVTFHTIQYSKKQKRLCFYTDNDLNIKNWEKKETTPPQPINTKEDITQSVLSVFDNEPIYDQDCASVYEILMLYRNLDKKIKQVHESIGNKIKNKLTTRVNEDLYCCIHDFEYDKHILPIHCSSRYSSYWDKYQYTKTPDGKIKEIKIEGFHDYNMLGNISDEVLELIDFYLSIEETRIQKKNRIKSVNSNLYINMDRYDVEVYVDENTGIHYLHKPKYSSKFYTYSDKVEHQYAYSDILERLNGNEMEFLQKIYVKIDDCPLWMREQLYNRRREEIRERKIKEEEELLRQSQIETASTEKVEEPTQKKLSLFQRVFPRKKEK